MNFLQILYYITHTSLAHALQLAAVPGEYIQRNRNHKNSQDQNSLNKSYIKIAESMHPPIRTLSSMS